MQKGFLLRAFHVPGEQHSPVGTDHHQHQRIVVFLRLAFAQGREHLKFRFTKAHRRAGLQPLGLLTDLANGVLFLFEFEETGRGVPRIHGNPGLGQIRQPSGVVVVHMGEEHRVQFFHAHFRHGPAQFSGGVALAGIDEYRAILVLNQNRIALAYTYGPQPGLSPGAAGHQQCPKGQQKAEDFFHSFNSAISKVQPSASTRV